MHTEKITYKEGDDRFEGYLTYDNTLSEKRPGILVGHANGGRDAFTDEKARELAKLGYVAFAWDIYGDGKTYTRREDKMEQMGLLLYDRPRLRRRLLAAFNLIKTLPIVDSHNIGAMGFCFGGLSVLDLARMGTDLKGVVSFHGALHKPENIPNQPVKAKILALHGYKDTMVTPEALHNFEKEMVESQVEDWQVHIFGNAYHAFMMPTYNHPELGLAYSQLDAARAWQMMADFFKEVFA